MLQIGTLKSFNSTDYRAEVQLAGSIAAYLDNIPVARNIAAGQVTAGRHVIVAIPGDNPKDACVIAVWDGAAGGGGPDHHATHEAGGADEINLEKLIGKPWAVFPFKASAYHTDWKNLDGWAQDNAGTGSVTCNILDLELATGTTINSRAAIYLTSNPLFHPHYVNTRSFIYIRGKTSLADSKIWLYRLRSGEAMPPTDISKHGGWKIVNGQIWASNADGTTETATDTGHNMSGAVRGMEFLGNSTSTAIEFRIWDVIEATHDTNLPQSWSYKFYIGITNTAAANKCIQLYVLNIIP